MAHLRHTGAQMPCPIYPLKRKSENSMHGDLTPNLRQHLYWTD